MKRKTFLESVLPTVFLLVLMLVTVTANPFVSLVPFTLVLSCFLIGHAAASLAKACFICYTYPPSAAKQNT